MCKSDPAKKLVEDVKILGNDTVELGKEFANASKRKMTEAYDKVLDASETAANYTKRNPLPAVGFGVALGLLTGFLIGKKR